MTIQIYEEIVQGTDEWLQLRCGILTASEMKNIITPSTIKYASNKDTRNWLYELANQRITQYADAGFSSWDMERGKLEEIEALMTYEKLFSRKVNRVGFITNDKWGFKIGYSPDGLIGDDGQVEAKSRKGKFQIETILSEQMPAEFAIQVQTGLLVSERKWCDFISYSGGLPMMTLRIHAVPEIQDAIVQAAAAFEKDLDDTVAKYNAIVERQKLPATKRKVYEDINA